MITVMPEAKIALVHSMNRNDKCKFQLYFHWKFQWIRRNVHLNSFLIFQNLSEICALEGLWLSDLLSIVLLSANVGTVIPRLTSDSTYKQKFHVLLFQLTSEHSRYEHISLWFLCVATIHIEGTDNQSDRGPLGDCLLYI